MEYAAEQALTAVPASRVQDFLRRVFGWMFAGLLIAGAAAAAIGSSDSLLTTITENPLILLGLLVVQIGLVIAISAAG